MLGGKPFAATAPLQPSRARARGKIPIAPAAPPLPTSRDFVPWRFSDAGRRSAWIASSSRRPKTCTISDIPAGKSVDWCKLVHKPQSATAVSFDPISRRFRSHFEAARCSQPRRSRTADCSETQTLFLNNRLALLRTNRADHALKELSDCIGTRNSVRK
jgi:hypothetical protein